MANDEHRTNSAKARPGEAAGAGGCASSCPAKAGPVSPFPGDPPKESEAAPKSILDPSFRYTASFDTDLKRTFARVRLERRRTAEREVRDAIQTSANVSSIVRKPFVVRS